MLQRSLPPAVALALLALAGGAASGMAQTRFTLPDTMGLPAPARALIRLEQSRSAAIARHDTATLSQIYAPEFRGITAAGYEVDRARLLGAFSRDDPTTVFSIDELAVRTIGSVQDAAFLTGRLTARRHSGELVAASRFIHVYLWREGRWQILAAQGMAGSQPESRNTLASLPDSIDWTENPAIPPGGQLAVLSGQPRATGLYAFRLKFPADYKVMPHSHPEDRIYTVLTGTWYIGLGNQFDPASLRAFTAGAVYRVPAGTTHFHWARSGESIVQVVGVGPTATDYVNPAEDPRRK